MNVFLKILLIDAIDAESTGKPFETVNESLSLPCLAAYLRKFLDSAEIRIIDRNVSVEIDRFAPDIVGISFVTVNYSIAKRYAGIGREKGAKVVGGGPHISSAPLTLPPEMDVGVVGEGEAALLELVRIFPNRRWEDAEELSRIPGIVFHADDGERKATPGRNPLSLDDLPLPARDLFHHPGRGIITSRGCPYKCVFCFRAHLERKVRYASPEKVIEEIIHLVETYRVQHIHIYDDLFNLPEKRFDYIVDALVAEGVPKRTSFDGNMRPNLVNDRLATQLKRLNVTGVFLGIESGVQRILSYLKPQVADVAQNERAVRILNGHGILTNAGIIIGSPDETKEEIMETLAWIKRSGLDMFEVLLLTPLPGTLVWEEAMERNLVSYDMDWSRLDLRADEIAGSQPVVVSKVLGKEEMLEIYRLFVEERKKYKSANTLKVTRKVVSNLLAHPGILLRVLGTMGSYRLLYNRLKMAVIDK